MAIVSAAAFFMLNAVQRPLDPHPHVDAAAGRRSGSQPIGPIKLYDQPQPIQKQ